MGMRRQEPVAVLGIGAMGHGMAVSALRAGIPTIVWNRGRRRPRSSAGWARRSPGARRTRRGGPGSW